MFLWILCARSELWYLSSLSNDDVARDGKAGGGTNVKNRLPLHGVSQQSSPSIEALFNDGSSDSVM